MIMKRESKGYKLLTPYEKGKYNKGLCKHAGCNRKRGAGRIICYTHKSRLYSQRHPVEATFYWLRRSAKRRGILFTISLLQWKVFISKTNYMEGRGRLFDQLSIDRIDGNKGYSIDNIQVIHKGKNSAKYHAVDKPARAVSSSEVENCAQETTNDNLPF